MTTKQSMGLFDNLKKYFNIVQNKISYIDLCKNKLI